jgi:4'-phosphopantetheinyl transferase
MFSSTNVPDDGVRFPTVDIWQLALTASHYAVDDFSTLLAPDEISRASQYKFDHLSVAFCLSRAALRALLGAYLEVRPIEARLMYGPNGKPMVAGLTSVRFNLSHSGDIAVFAFTSDIQIGIDIERIHLIENIQEIAKQCLCSEEQSELASISSAELKTRAFFNCWTRKEAFIKATGEGLTVPLDSFCVTLMPESDARLKYVSGQPGRPETWSLCDLNLHPDYAAAIAYQGPVRRVRVFPLMAFREFLQICS